MDQRRAAPHPFSRSQTSQTAHDPRFAPVPPPPYTSQPAAQGTSIAVNNGPFLRRGNEQDYQRRSPPPANPPRTYNLPSNSQLTANLFPGSSDFANIAQPRRNSYGSTTPFAAEGTDRYGARTGSDADPQNNNHLQQTLLPPPPPSSSSYGLSSQLRNAQADSARQMTNESATPKMLEDQPLPPPPPFNARHMLPPSSPPSSQSQQGLQAPSSQRPPPPPPSSGNRELPALTNAPRPGSSMSISSMLGTDPGRPARESISYSNPSTSTIIPATASPSLPAQSPTRLHHNGVSTQRSHSPEKYKLAHGPTTRPFRAYSGGSPRRPTSSADVTFPEVSKYGTQLFTQPQHSPSSDMGSRQEWKNAFDRYQSTDRVTPRPNSQPSSYSTPQSELPDKLHQQSAKSEIEGFRRLGYAERYHELAQGKSREATIGQTRHHGEPQAMSEPRDGLLPDRKLANTPAHISPTQGRSNGSSYPFLARSAAKPEAGNGRFGPQADSLLDRMLERNPSAMTMTYPSQSPFSPESLRRLREERLVAVDAQPNSVHQPAVTQQSRFMEHADTQQDHGYSRNASVPASLGAPSAMDIDHQCRTGEEMNQLQKSSLSLFMENQKRAGRVSPLPQAVQGAQGKISTPASEPGIKSEFAKMFIGIGSGVGSAGPMRSETSTPFQRSPIRNQEMERRTSFGARTDLADLNKPRAGSRGGRRPKKARNEDLKVDIENGDGRASAGIGSSRGVKRSRSHHHHTTVHHHHHDEMGNPILHHHHHHPDHRHHRHSANHQQKIPAAPPAESARTPKTIIKNDALLESVKELPRHHLGSILYSPIITSTYSRDILHTKLGYTSTPNPIPRFDGQENCTFTVRVPRFYLTAAEREDITRRRTVWGSGVYSDDSDPLAAAIHAGWICGDWGEDIDLSMLSMNPAGADPKPASSASTKSKRATETISSPPSEPILPLTGKDLHLTLLILPCLQSYASTTAHGLKSRSWGGDHDGVSFQIEKMAWVNEGVGEMEERGGEARKKRMKLGSGGMKTGSGSGAVLKLPLGGRKRMGLAGEERGVGVSVGA